MIRAHTLTKRFGRFCAVDSLDFEIPKGCVAGFLGPNGAGKTTTIRMMTGFLPPTAGTVQVDGFDSVHERRQVQKRIGYLPEATPLYPEMRVIEYLRFRAKLFGLMRNKRRAAIDLAISRCWLREVERRLIGQLSRGYRQRVALAAALLHEPPILILDEPTTGLDPTQVREFRGLIRELSGAHTILLSTHILPEVEAMCNYVLMIARGRIRAQGTLDEIRSSAAVESRYIVETTARNADNIIRGIVGVTRVQQSPIDKTWNHFTITAKEDAPDLREAISKAILINGSSIRELHRESATIEQLFVRMMSATEESLVDVPEPKLVRAVK